MARRERRSFRLSFTTPIVLKYSRDSDEGIWRYSSGLATDVSLEGAAVLLPEAIRPGSTIALAVLSPTAAGSPERLEIAKQATVMWVDDKPITRPSFRHGLRFTDPDVDILFRAWPGERVSE
jgi:hypothetical protein